MMRMPDSGGKGGNSSKPDSPSTAFSNWRKQNTGNNVAPGFKKALQIQCKWMLLCLRKADAEKNERELNVSSSVLSMLDEVAANAKDVGEQLPMVSGASEVIRTYLNIGDYRSETLSKRQWDREKACFELGDQVAALEKMKSLISSIKEPSEKQRAIRDLEFLLLTPAEQAKLREERMNRRMPGGPRF